MYDLCGRERMKGVRFHVCVYVLHTFALSIMLIWSVWSENCSHFAIHHGIIETIFPHSQSMFRICLFNSFYFWKSFIFVFFSLKSLFSLRPENSKLYTAPHQRNGTEQITKTTARRRRRRRRRRSWKENIVWKIKPHPFLIRYFICIFYTFIYHMKMLRIAISTRVNFMRFVCLVWVWIILRVFEFVFFSLVKMFSRICVSFFCFPFSLTFLMYTNAHT